MITSSLTHDNVYDLKAYVTLRLHILYDFIEKNVKHTIEEKIISYPNRFGYLYGHDNNYGGIRSYHVMICTPQIVTCSVPLCTFQLC